MDYVHHCVVCDWERYAASPAVTSPRCENCGCALASMHVSEVAVPAGPVKAVALPAPVTRALLKSAALTGMTVLMLAAVRTGYDAGGLFMAMTAVGLVGLLMAMVAAADAS